jgi:hypothetical protein
VTIKPFAMNRRLVAMLCVVATIGCGPPKTIVTGTVTLDGQPLERASVEFFPRDGKGRTAGGFTDPAGRYRVEVSPGEMGATVSLIKVVRQDRRQASEDNPDGNVMEEIIPRRFSDRGKTELTVTSAAGKTTTADFALTSDPR